MLGSPETALGSGATSFSCLGTTRARMDGHSIATENPHELRTRLRFFSAAFRPANSPLRLRYESTRVVMGDRASGY